MKSPKLEIQNRVIRSSELKNKAIFFTIILSLFITELIASPTFHIPNDSTFSKNPVYNFETSMYKLNKLSNPTIVMFGDSHIEGARWNELLGIYKVIYRGVSGDVTEGLKHRLNEILKLNPKIVIIEAGINDVYNWVKPEIIINNFKYIIKKLSERNIQVIVTSIFYAGKYWGKEWIEKNNPGVDVVKNNRNRNKLVKTLNAKLKKICKHYGAIFVDVNEKLSQNGFLKDAYSRDQLHLNAEGYKIWAEELEKVLKRLNIDKQEVHDAKE